MSLTVQEFDRKDNSFEVYCTSYGGRPLSMSLTSPSGIEDLMNIVGLGEVEGIGNDTVSAKALYQGGKNGDIYNCTASNIVSMSSYEIGLKSMLHFGHYISYLSMIISITSVIKTNYRLCKADIFLISESGVESAIRRSHSDWLCSTLQ